MSHHRADVLRIVAWGPGPGVVTGQILALLRAEGFSATIGARREPAGNFEVACLPGDLDRVADLIATIDPAAEMLTVGR